MGFSTASLALDPRHAVYLVGTNVQVLKLKPNSILVEIGG